MAMAVIDDCFPTAYRSPQASIASWSFDYYVELHNRKVCMYVSACVCWVRVCMAAATPYHIPTPIVHPQVFLDHKAAEHRRMKFAEVYVVVMVVPHPTQPTSTLLPRTGAQKTGCVVGQDAAAR